MSESCNNDCSNCSADCASRDPKSFLEPPHVQSTIRKVIGVVSGKGGVGKSMVSSMLAANFQKRGIILLYWMLILQAHPFRKHLVSMSVLLVTKTAFTLP